MTRILLLTVLMIPAAPCRADTAAAEAALDRAVTYLWSKQNEDGAWRSEKYGMMRGGESLTPFVLNAILLTIDDISSDEAGKVRRAAQFICDHLDDEGALGRSDPDVLEYPVYSTAYAIKCFMRMATYQKMLGPGPWNDNWETIRKMQSFLVAAQYQESNGFDPNDVAYGGWGFNAPLKPGVVGHMDLGHTRVALETLWLPRRSDTQYLVTGTRVLRFLALMQKRPETLRIQPLPEGAVFRDSLPFDGGFYFSPVALSANKAPYDVEMGCWPSYATATCDGILALLAAGVPEDDKRLLAAVNWLKEHRDVDYPQGVPTDHPEPWGDAVRFYHYMVRAEVYRRLAFPAADRERLAAAVVARQRPDGSFASDEPLMKEDDPLLCTSLAVAALANCLPESR
jgi:hypothetical protein